MLNVVMSQAAAGLLRALLSRSGSERHRFLLSEIRSVDWQSLTLAGERHSIQLRIAGPEANTVANRFVDGIEDAEFVIGGQIVADIALVRPPRCDFDGSVTLDLEALTVVE
jgi:hypothetical protein